MERTLRYNTYNKLNVLCRNVKLKLNERNHRRILDARREKGSELFVHLAPQEFKTFIWPELAAVGGSQTCYRSGFETYKGTELNCAKTTCVLSPDGSDLAKVESNGNRYEPCSGTIRYSARTMRLKFDFKVLKSNIKRKKRIYHRRS